MGRKKLSNIKTTSKNAARDVPLIDYSTQPVDKMCPTLHKVTTNKELNLLELSSVQLELERLLSSVLERLQCLSAESKDKPIPLPIMQVLRSRKISTEQEMHHGLYGRPSLVVKSNPEKPLTLIISQRDHHTHQPILPIPEPATHNRIKSFPNPVPVRRMSRSVDGSAEQGSVRSPDRNQSHAGYEIPNKFWELMEPYCAEITEANINYLEGLIRSYQDMESTFFQPPVPCTTESIKPEEVESPATKRPRRDSTHISTQLGDSFATPIPPASLPTPPPPQSPSFATNRASSSSTDWSNYVDAEMSKPLSDASSLGKLSESLLQSCFQDNILFTFTESLKRVAEQSGKSAEDLKSEMSCTLPVSTCSSSKVEAELSSLPSSAFADRPFVIPESLQSYVTEKASQPLKSLAKELRVSSTYRMEKEISQAMNELGLMPSNVFHPTMQSSADGSKDVKSNFKLLNRLEAPVTSGIDTHLNVEAQPCSKFPSSQLGEHPIIPSPTPVTRSNWSDEDDAKVGRPSHNNRRRKSATHLVCSESSTDPEKSSPSSPTRAKPGGARRNRSKNGYSTVQQKNNVRFDNDVHSSSPSNGIVDDLPDGKSKQSHFSPSAESELLNGFLKTEDVNCDRTDSSNSEHHNSSFKYSTRRRTESIPLPSSPNGTCGKSKPTTPTQLMQNGSSGGTNCNSPQSQYGLNDCTSFPLDTNTLNSLPSHMDQQLDVKPDGPLASGDDGFVNDTSKLGNNCMPSGTATTSTELSRSQTNGPIATDEVSLAILQHQQELRLVCSQNLSLLRKLVQAARRDMQRQEIQRRLAIADADVIEAYNKLESYRPQRKPPLKRDRDAAHKALKERCKVLKELDAFDAKLP